MFLHMSHLKNTERKIVSQKLAVPLHSLVSYRGVDIELQSSLTSELGGCEWSNSSAAFTPQTMAVGRTPGTH
jgi:hypothetical protein